MSFNEYQKLARATRIYHDKLMIVYPTLGLAGEAGEVAEKVKKLFRDGDGIITEEKVSDLEKELGDVLWYIANLASDLGLSMENIAKKNIEKLYSRKERGTLHGEGDNR